MRSLHDGIGKCFENDLCELRVCKAWSLQAERPLKDQPIVYQRGCYTLKTNPLTYMLKFSESFHLHPNCCTTKRWRMAHPTRKAEEESQTLSDGPCNAYQDSAPLMRTQHNHKTVHNTR